MKHHDVLPPLTLEAPRLDPGLARSIRLVCFDVDGVLTDGGIYLGAGHPGPDDGDAIPFEFKRYDIQDGMGMALLRSSGLELAIITGRVSHSTKQRARELHIDICIQDSGARKLPALRALCEERDIALNQVAFVGDDIPDLAVLREVGLPVAVGNAVPEVRREAILQLTRHGGHGAVREFAEALLKARDQWIDVVEEYVRTRSNKE